MLFLPGVCSTLYIVCECVSVYVFFSVRFQLKIAIVDVYISISVFPLIFLRSCVSDVLGWVICFCHSHILLFLISPFWPNHPESYPFRFSFFPVFFFPHFIPDPFRVATLEHELIPADVYQSINESLEFKCLLDSHLEKEEVRLRN